MMRLPEFNYGVLKFRDQNVNWSILLGRNLSEWTSIMRSRFYANSLIKHGGRNTIRMGYVTDTHPRAYRLVSMRAPVSRSAKCSRREQPGDHQCHQKEQEQYPFTPPKFFHACCENADTTGLQPVVLEL
jgi:hypothetical protein